MFACNAKNFEIAIVFYYFFYWKSGRTGNSFFCIFFFFCCSRQVWLMSDLLTRHGKKPCLRFEISCVRAWHAMYFRDKQKWQISASMPIATKLVTVVTYHEELPPIKWHDPFTTWSSEILRSRDKQKPLDLHYHSAYGH